MPKKDIEIYLKSLYVINNGVMEKGKAGKNALIVELIHPTTGRGTAVFQDTKLEFLAEHTINFETVTQDNSDLLKYDEFDRLMFKEELYNKAKLDILLTHTEDVKAFEILMVKVFHSIINIGGVLLPGIVNALSSSLIEAGKKIREQNEEKDKKIYEIGKASRVLSLDSKELEGLKPGESKDIKIQLTVPETITKKVLRFVEGSEKTERVPKVVLKKSEGNEYNAVLTITVKCIE